MFHSAPYGRASRSGAGPWMGNEALCRPDGDVGVLRGILRRLCRARHGSSGAQAQFRRRVARVDFGYCAGRPEDARPPLKQKTFTGSPSPTLDAVRLRHGVAVDTYASNLSNDPFQPKVMPPLALMKVSSSSRVAAPCGSHVTVTRVRLCPSAVNCTVVSMVSGHVGAMGWRTTLSFSSQNCWV